MSISFPFHFRDDKGRNFAHLWNSKTDSATLVDADGRIILCYDNRTHITNAQGQSVGHIRYNYADRTDDWVLEPSVGFKGPEVPPPMTNFYLLKYEVAVSLWYIKNFYKG